MVGILCIILQFSLFTSLRYSRSVNPHNHMGAWDIEFGHSNM
jgi:hypothetical protein